MSATILVPEWPAPPTVRAVQSTRNGGVSHGHYASLNLALHVGDEQALVNENRRRLGQFAELPAQPNWLEQIHGARAVDLDIPWSGPADAAVTGSAGTVCAVMTADCLPLLLADANGQRIGVAHGGWRGLAAGVIPAAIAALDVAPASILAWLGPAIGPTAYEVGDEVRSAFVHREPAAAGAFAINDHGRWQADLYMLARLELAAAGVVQVFGGGQCTASDPKQYFSHRREAPCGRMATLIWIEPAA